MALPFPSEDFDTGGETEFDPEMLQEMVLKLRNGQMDDAMGGAVPLPYYPGRQQGGLPPPGGMSSETRSMLMNQIKRLSEPVQRKTSMWTDPAFLAGMTLLGGGNFATAAQAASNAEARAEQTRELSDARRATSIAHLTGKLAEADKVGALAAKAQREAGAKALALVAPTQRGRLAKLLSDGQIDPTDMGAVYDLIASNNIQLAPNYKSVPGVGLVDMVGEGNGQPKVVIEAQKQFAPGEIEQALTAAGYTPGTPDYITEAKKLLAKKQGAGEGPFSGTGEEVQMMNYLLNPKSDPNSAEYALAYWKMTQPKPMQIPDKDGNMVMSLVTPVLPPNIRRPGAPASAAPQGGTPAPAPSLAPAPAASGAPSTPPAAPPPATPEPVPGVHGATVTPIGNPKPPQFTEGQANAALYADRMRASGKIIDELEQEGLDPYSRGASKIPGVGNFIVSSRYQQLDQAKRDFINATLRRESGAVISPAEFENADKQYFPVPGDSPEVLAQKKQNRRIALEGISRAAGPAYKPAQPTAASSTPPPPPGFKVVE